MAYKIQQFDTNDTRAVISLFPTEWNFDFLQFIKIHNGKSYFKAYTLGYEDDIIGFGNLFIFDNIAWLGNIVIDKKIRKTGFGSMITEHLILEAKQTGAETFNLVATELGQPLYDKLGFKTEQRYEYYKPIKEIPTFAENSNIRKATINDFETICSIDFAITQENRKELLISFMKNTKVYCETDNEITGFYAPDFGTGIVFAMNYNAGIELLKSKINDQKKIIVIPEKNQDAKKFLLLSGFGKYQNAPRMYQGKKILWNTNCVYNRPTGYCG